MDIGQRFQPGADETQFQPRGQGGQGSAPQEAIRTLSLRVPQTTSVPGLAPLPLLNAPGGGRSDLDVLLKALLAAFGGGGQGLAGGPSRGFGTPRFTPVDPPNDFPGGGAGPVQTKPQIPRDFPQRDPNMRPTPIPAPDIPDEFPPYGGQRWPGGTAIPGGIQPLF